MQRTKSISKATIKKSHKLKSITKLKKDADQWFSRYVRLRDADKSGWVKCITCPTLKPWQEMQNGHFVSRTVSLLRFDEQNCNAQCAQCNVFNHGVLHVYYKELDLKYGDGTADKLLSQSHTTHKFTRNELELIIEEAKTYVKNCDKR